MRKAIDLTGQKFGRLTVVKRDSIKGPSGQIKWICQCECGKTKSIMGCNLKNNLTLSCGCLHKEKTMKNLINQRFGRLTVLKKTDKRTKDRNIIWECQCDCGKKCEVSTNNLIQKYTKSCGCLKHDLDLQGRTFKNLIGQKFGKLTVIKKTNKRNNNGSIVWKCQCDCGNVCEAISTYLLSGEKYSCGCTKSKGEEEIAKLLLQYNIPFEKEKIFEQNENGGYYRFDFYVDNQYIIEYDGIQHFYSGSGWNTLDNLKNTQKKDKEKNLWCKKNNIPIIRIPYTQLEKLTISDLKIETSKFIIDFIN